MTSFLDRINENIKYREYVDNLKLTHSFVDMVDAVENKVFGFSLFNLFVINLEALKERFFINHDTSGNHSPKKMGWKGPSAYGRFKQGTGLIENLSISSAVNTGTGIYTFTLSGGLSSVGTVQIATYMGVNKYRAEVATTGSTGTIEARVYNTSNSLVNLASGESVTIALFEPYP